VKVMTAMPRHDLTGKDIAQVLHPLVALAEPGRPASTGLCIEQDPPASGWFQNPEAKL
jgi:hypothetical protein